MKMTICHLYPSAMSIYGDRGNVIALTQRARWRGIDVELRAFELGDVPSFADVDLFFFGGGQDKEQVTVSQHLQGAVGEGIKAAIESGAALLSVCGGYQLLGHYFRTGTGDRLPGISLFDAHTVAGSKRFIGDVIVESRLGLADGSEPRTLVGFENHSGLTYLGSGCQPLGRSIVGSGNNGEDRFEGAVYRNAIGCYLHGSLLPKNPWLTDHLLGAALAHRQGGSVALEPLDDSLEDRAHRAVYDRIRLRGRVNSAIKSK